MAGGRAQAPPAGPRLRERSSDALVLASGATSGVVSRTLTAPLDRVKLVLQVGGTPLVGALRLGGPDIQQGRLLGAARAILRDAGWRGFWQGNTANVLKTGPEYALRFCAYEKVERALSRAALGSPLSERFASGCVAGGVAQAAVYPLEIAKTRLAVCSAGTYRGLVHCLFDAVQREGPRSLYRGLGPALLSIVPASGVDLAVYNTLKDKYFSVVAMEGGTAHDIPIPVSLGLGVAAGASGAVVAYPLTVVRTKLIAQGMPGRPVRFSSALHCFQQIHRDSGVRGMWRGLAPALLKTVPAVSASYATFEATKRLGRGWAPLGGEQLGPCAASLWLSELCGRVWPQSSANRFSMQ